MSVCTFIASNSPLKEVAPVVFLFGYYSKIYWLATLLLIMIALVYILWINPRYMNRYMTKEKHMRK